MHPRVMASVLGLCVWPAVAQWTLQNSGSAADLRGIDFVGGDVAWASGNHGTVLRTEDKGRTWQQCATPHGAEQLDFRGVQAFDAMTAIVMSSGKGGLSRLYKTADGCKTWKLVFTNPDEDGFFDAVRRPVGNQLYAMGDPVGGKFAMFTSRDAGDTWFIADDPGLEAPKGESAFAASNSSLTSVGPYLIFGTGGSSTAVYMFQSTCNAQTGQCASSWIHAPVPMAQGSTTSGIFSLAGRFAADARGKIATRLVAVGGAYDKADETAGSAAFNASGEGWERAQSLPHGYRSAVAYDKAASTWVTVGPNGTDVSTDDGRNWRALKPGPGDDPEADQHWNALSLPFVVGPKGRIGVLRGDALRTIATPKER